MSLGFPDPPAPIADTVAGTLNSSPWTWCPLWTDVAYGGTPSLELSPVRFDTYDDGSPAAYRFSGTFLLPYVGEDPSPYLISNASGVQWSGRFNFSIGLFWPVYSYGAGYLVAIALNVETAFSLRFLTVTFDSDGSPISTVATPIDAHLVSGPLQARRTGAPLQLPADVDLGLSTTDAFTVAPGASPFGTVDLADQTGTVARWLSLRFDDPDTGASVTVTFSNGIGPTVYSDDVGKAYKIDSFARAGEFAPGTYLTSGNTFGQRTYSRHTFGNTPDYGSPYVSVPDTALLTLCQLLSIEVTRSVFAAPLISPPADAPSRQPTGYRPSVIANIALPAGGGSPRLALASARTYREITIDQSFDSSTQTLTRNVNRKYTIGAVRSAVSHDLGASFAPAADIGASAADGTALADGLTGEDTATETYTLVRGAFVYAGASDPSPWPYAFPHPLALVCLAHGGVLINGSTVPPDPASPTLAAANYRQREWAAARRTDDASGRSGWRSAGTPNDGTGTGPRLSGNGATWRTRGGYAGTHGAGGKSGGPDTLVHANTLASPLPTLVSADGGDTWTVSSMTASSIPATSALAHQRGGSFDGAAFSLADFLGATPAAVGGLPAGIAYLLAGADGETVRVAVVDHTTGQVTIATCRAALGAVPWTLADGPAIPSHPAFPVAGFTWQQRCVLAVCPEPDIIAVYVSEDDCGTWHPACWSSSNMETWRTGGYDA